MNSREQVAQFLAKPLQDARFADADGPGAHAEFLRDVLGGAIIDDGLPERLPGLGLEFAAQEIETAKEQAALRAMVGRTLLFGRREAREAICRRTAARALRFTSASAMQI